MNKKSKCFLIFLGLLIIIGIVVIIIKFNTRTNKDNEVIDNKPVSLEMINGYDYTLKDRDTNLFKEKYNNLKEVLSKENIDYEKYAEILSELYIIDLYTINNKNNKYDVGSIIFVYPEAASKFEMEVRESLYKFVEDNSDNTRTQVLPEVKSVDFLNINKKSFKLNDVNVEGYSVTLEWNYIEDLGYDNKATIDLAKIDNKLYVIGQS